MTPCLVCWLQRKRQTKEPLVNAAKNGDWEKTEQLITSGACCCILVRRVRNVEWTCGFCPCIAASSSADGRREYVNRQDKNGSTRCMRSPPEIYSVWELHLFVPGSLFHAVWPLNSRTDKSLEILLRYGGDPNVQNNRKNTALHLACERCV